MQHPDYDNGDASFAHDIAVVVLSEPANVDGNEYIQGINFAREGMFAGETCDFTGWGRSKPNLECLFSYCYIIVWMHIASKT